MGPVTTYTPEDGEFDRVFKTEDLRFSVDQDLIAPYAGLEDDIAHLAQLLSRINRYTDRDTVNTLVEHVAGSLQTGRRDS